MACQTDRADLFAESRSQSYPYQRGYYSSYSGQIGRDRYGGSARIDALG
jgi:hypothetical protein